MDYVKGILRLVILITFFYLTIQGVIFQQIKQQVFRKRSFSTLQIFTTRVLCFFLLIGAQASKLLTAFFCGVGGELSVSFNYYTTKNFRLRRAIMFGGKHFCPPPRKTLTRTTRTDVSPIVGH